MLSGFIHYHTQGILDKGLADCLKILTSYLGNPLHNLLDVAWLVPLAPVRHRSNEGGIRLGHNRLQGHRLYNLVIGPNEGYNSGEGEGEAPLDEASGFIERSGEEMDVAS